MERSENVGSAGSQSVGRRLPFPPKGAYCNHPRMKFVKCYTVYPRDVYTMNECSICDKKHGTCMVHCRDCGLEWSFWDGRY